MNAIQITNDLLDKSLTNKPSRFDMAVNFYCCLEKDNKYYLVAYYYNPAWDLYYPFYDDVNKTPIIQVSKSNTYRQLIQETNQIIDIDLEEKLELAHKRFIKLIGCACKVKQAKTKELFELKYSKTAKQYSIYKLYNFIITEVEDLKTILNPQNLKCELFDLDNLDNAKLVSNAIWFCEQSINELKENAIHYNSDFESIIPTALHTLYPLTFTDIPFSNEIYNELCKIGFPNELKNEKITFEIEARYKLIDKFLKESNITQILELASGFTPRGLNWCLEKKDVVYVELDLPQVIEKKKNLLRNIIELPQNLYFVGGNALSTADIQNCLTHFDLAKPVAVINQGLMRYLDFNEKKTLAENIFAIVNKNKGLWITCDLTPAKFIVNQNKNIDTNYNTKLTQVTNRNNASWRFKDKQHAELFLKEVGFNIEWHEFTESLPLISSPIKFNLTKKPTQ